MKLATIEKITVLKEHSNADALEIVEVLGYQAVVPIGLHKEGDLVVYIQPDTVLPKDQEWAEEYIRYSPKRVKACKLRGIWSEGVVAPLSKFDDIEDFQLWFIDDSCIGTEVSESIGVVKYDPPLPTNESAIGGLPYGLGKTDEERCLSEDTILFTDVGVKTIKEICDNKIFCNVFSYNEDTNENEFKKVETHSIKRNNNDWYEIELYDGKKIKCTNNHLIYLPKLKCYRRTDELKVNDLVKIYEDVSMIDTINKNNL